MGKGRKRNKGKAAGLAVRKAGADGIGNVHPLIVTARANGAQLDQGKFEVADVANPFGEVIIRGELRRHKAVRRVPHFETLYRSKVFDRTVFDCLDWYAGKLATADASMFKCGLDTSGGGGGSAQSHIPTTQAAMEARSDIAWARGFIPADMRAVFDGVMVDGDSFDAIGRRLFHNMSPGRAARRASSTFKLAANYLLLGIGHRVCGLPRPADNLSVAA